jgi:hypothetical protein
MRPEQMTPEEVMSRCYEHGQPDYVKAGDTIKQLIPAVDFVAWLSGYLGSGSAVPVGEYDLAYIRRKLAALCAELGIHSLPAEKQHDYEMWQDIIKARDERPLPTYGQIPWDQLGRDVLESATGTRHDYKFDPQTDPGHQMVPALNFNSLSRIVDKYRRYGLQCAPPARMELPAIKDDESPVRVLQTTPTVTE